MIIKFNGQEHQLFQIIDEEKDLISLEVENKDGSSSEVGKIISKNGIKKLRDKFNLKVSFLFFNKDNAQTIFTKHPIIQIIQLTELIKVAYVFCQVTGEEGEGKREPAVECGEICLSGKSKNLGGISERYPIAMLYKRAYGRAILDFLYLYEYYTEEEADDFKESFQEKEIEKVEFEKDIGEVKCSECKKIIEDNEEKIKAKRRIEVFGAILCDKCLLEKHVSKGSELNLKFKKEEKENGRGKEGQKKG